MSFQEKSIRSTNKKKFYAPIMLTSKAIKPIQKADLKKQERQSQHKQLSKQIFNKDQNNSFEMFTKQMQKRKIKVLISDQLLCGPKKNISMIKLKNDEDSVFNFGQSDMSINTKFPVSTSIVKMQFSSADKSIRKNNSRYFQHKIKKQISQDIDIQLEHKQQVLASMYYTKIKTFSQLQKASKGNKNIDIFSNAFRQKIFQRKLAKINKLKYQQEWNKYLNKYYLKIKQVNPVTKMNSTMRESQHKDFNQYVNLQNIPFQNIERTRSNTIMTKGKLTRTSKSQLQNGMSDFQKIQRDILDKKVNMSKKDFFVFGMSDIQIKNQNINKLKFQNYKDFIWKINFSNSIYIKLPQQILVPYKVYIGNGNNSSLIKGIIKRRFWWQIIQKISDQPNFVWTQLKNSQFHSSQKLSVYKKTQYFHKYRQKSDIQNFDNESKQLLNLNKKILNQKDFELWQNNYKINKSNQDKYNQIIYQKRLKSMIKKKIITFAQETQSFKVHNHFQCNYFLGNKKALFYSLRKYYSLKKQNPFQFIPLTFHITDGLNDPQFSLFLSQFQKIAEQRLKNKQLKNIWIMKPGQNSNRGRGITVCATLDQIKIRLKNKQKNSDGSVRTYILQRYIQKPLLYNRRKFDLRHYMLLTCINGQIKGYWYSQGYIRTTSSEYNIKNCKDLYTHLTNDAVQKNSADYGKFQKGNKVSYEDFQKYLVKNVSKSADFFLNILPIMKQLAKDSISATYSNLQPNRNQHNFQLFGLDFMIDEQMKVYLIEVNTNPCLQISCPLLGKIITPLIQNVFKICVDPLFPPMYEFPSTRKFQLGQNSFLDNKFQLFFDENIDGLTLKQMYEDQSNFDTKMGIVEQENQLYQDQGEWKQEQNV